MLEEFYRDNYPTVYGYLLSLCGDPQHAEDLTSQTFLKAIEKINSYDPRYKASTRLCTIGRNLYINERKRHRRFVSMGDHPEPAVPSAEELYLQRAQADAVLQAATSLPKLQRQVLFMRLRGLRFRAIADALGKTENWARVTFYRAKSRIIEETEEKA